MAGNAQVQEPDDGLLLHVVREVLENRAGIDDLAAQLESARASLATMRSEFNRTVSGQVPAVQEACREAMLAVDRDFEAYRTALDDAETYLATFDLRVLTSVLPRLEQATAALDEHFFAFRQTGLVALGPTAVPGINLLIHHARAILAGDSEQIDILREHAAQEEVLTRSVLQDTRPAGDGVAVVRSLVAYLGVLKRLTAGLDSPEPQALQTSVDELIRVAATFRSQDPELEARQLAEGSTPYPIVNTVLNVGEGIREGRFEAALLEPHLKALDSQVQVMRLSFNAVTRHPPTSPVVEEEVDGVGQAIGHLEGAVNLYWEYLRSHQVPALVTAQESLTQSAQAIDRCLDSLRGWLDRDGKIPCVKCGHLNPAGLRTCGRCNCVLPTNAGASFSSFEMQEGEVPQAPEGESETVVTENVHALSEAVTAFADGSASREDLEQTLAWMESLLADAYRAVGVTPGCAVSPEASDSAAGTEASDAAPQDARLAAMRLYLEGLEDYAVGLEFIRQAAADVNRDGLQAGLQMIWRGTERLQQVPGINR